LTSLLASLLVGSASLAGQPKIACREPVHNFGSVTNTERVLHTFEIRNEGDAPLQIGDLRACCGATMKMAEKVIAPGTNAMVESSFPLSGRSGHQRKTFYISSNDPSQPYLQLCLEGTALSSNGLETAEAPAAQVEEGDFQIIPSELILLEPADAAKSVARYVLIHSRDGRPFKVLKTQPPRPGIEISVSTLPSGDTRILLTGIRPSKALDKTTLVITTDRDSAKTISIPFRFLPRPHRD
jgi:hypothetical protein